MKKIIALSLVAATLLFTGCGDDSKKSTSEAETKATTTTSTTATTTPKEATQTVVDVAAAAADKTVKATKEAANTATEVVKKAVESAKETVTTATLAAVDSVLSDEGQRIYAKCSGCHGMDGKRKALNKSAIIAGQSKVDLMTKLKAYKAGTRNEAGMGNLMKSQMATLDDVAIAEVATYISTLK